MEDKKTSPRQIQDKCNTSQENMEEKWKTTGQYCETKRKHVGATFKRIGRHVTRARQIKTNLNRSDLEDRRQTDPSGKKVEDKWNRSARENEFRHKWETNGQQVLKTLETNGRQWQTRFQGSWNYAGSLRVAAQRAGMILPPDF